VQSRTPAASAVGRSSFLLVVADVLALCGSERPEPTPCLLAMDQRRQWAAVVERGGGTPRCQRGEEAYWI
jgi:hypothetical protein